MTVEVQINHYDIRVLIDGLPQVYILRSELVGFSSWADDNAMAVIEYHTKSGVIRTEFDDSELPTHGRADGLGFLLLRQRQPFISTG